MECEVCLWEKPSLPKEASLLRTFGLSEEEIKEKLSQLPHRIKRSQGGIDILFEDPGDRDRAGKVLGQNVYSTGEPMEEVVGRLLRQKGYTLSCAESCTGGLVSTRIVNVPGSSDYFVGGVIVYSNRLKVDLLGVGEETLRKFGAVSEETCREMLMGLRERLGTDCGVAITGIAGPGGSGPKPEGLTYIGVYVNHEESIEERILPGSRNGRRFLSSQIALNKLRLMLQEEEL